MYFPNSMHGKKGEDTVEHYDDWIARAEMRSSAIAQGPARGIVQQLSAELLPGWIQVGKKPFSTTYILSLYNQTVTLRRYL